VLREMYASGRARSTQLWEGLIQTGRVTAWLKSRGTAAFCTKPNGKRGVAPAVSCHRGCAPQAPKVLMKRKARLGASSPHFCKSSLPARASCPFPTRGTGRGRAPGMLVRRRGPSVGARGIVGGGSAARAAAAAAAIAAVTTAAAASESEPGCAAAKPSDAQKEKKP